jgi:hypothetical protein
MTADSGKVSAAVLVVKMSMPSTALIATERERIRVQMQRPHWKGPGKIGVKLDNSLPIYLTSITQKTKFSSFNFTLLLKEKLNASI